MNYSKILLKNSNVIDENGKLEKNLNIYIHNGKIEEISTESVKEDYESIDCTNFYITPGFVNLHTHSPMNIMKGIAEDISIENWFNEKIFPYESKLENEDYIAKLAREKYFKSEEGEIIFKLPEEKE